MKNLSRHTTSAFLFILACSTPMAAQNVRTFVASYGVDSNPCSRTAPCRNFAAAIAQTNPAGEVVALDSSGYGPVIIGQSVTLVAPPGVHAAVAPTSGAAVVILAGVNDTITLRGLYLNSQGAVTGVNFLTGNTLHVENCVVSGFSDYGILVDRTVTNFARVFVLDTTVRDGGFQGLSFRNTSAGAGAQIRGIVQGCQVVRNGPAADGSANIRVGENARIFVRDTNVSASTVGFTVVSNTADLDAELTLVDSASVMNTSAGLYAYTTAAGAQALIRVSNTTILGNNNGVVTIGAGAFIYSKGDNTLEGNNSGNTFANFYLPK